jgi:glycosyltransferase involved in cell wall biosynthesis
MRVLHVITGLAPGGAEQQLRLLVRHQCVPAEVAVLTNPGSVARGIRSDGIAVHDMAMRSNTDMSAVPRLVRLIRAGGFDVVHTHLFRAGLYGRLAARMAGVRHVVATEHSLGERWLEERRVTRGVRALYLAAERLGETTIAVSHTVARRLLDLGIPRSRIQVIPNGIVAADYAFDRSARDRVRAALGIPPDVFLVGSIARLVATKRLDLLLRALPDRPDVCLVIAGDGPQRSELNGLADSLRTRATFVGDATDVPSLLSALDILVNVSVSETFGLSVIEGLAAGLPVLYTACPAVDELPPVSAPGARRMTATKEGLRDALEAEVRLGQRRLRPPPSLQNYDIARLAGKVESVYAHPAGARQGHRWRGRT